MTFERRALRVLVRPFMGERPSKDPKKDIFPNILKHLPRKSQKIPRVPYQEEFPKIPKHPKSPSNFFYRQLDFSSEPGVAKEILENEPKSCLTVA